jgi:type IV secretory pathway TraG/TraD family ATPase VirD4
MHTESLEIQLTGFEKISLWWKSLKELFSGGKMLFWLSMLFSLLLAVVMTIYFCYKQNIYTMYTNGILAQKYWYHHVSYKFYLYFFKENIMPNALFSLMTSFMASPFMAIVILMLSKAKAYKILKPKHSYGPKCLNEEQLQTELNKLDLEVGLNVTPKVGIPKIYETNHIGVGGSTGSGKTQIISVLTSQLIERDIRMIVHELKGDYYKRFAKENDLIFCPLDKRHMGKYKGWSIKSSIKDIQDINTVSAALIPANPRAKEPYWYIAPRDEVNGILRFCYLEDKMTNKDIWEVCSLPISELAARLKDVPGAEAAYSHISNPESRAAQDVKAVMMSYLGAFEFLQYTDGDFVIEDWLQEGKESLYLLNFPSITACMKPAMTVFMNLLLNRMLSLDADLHRRIALIMDEFPQLHKIESLPNFLALSRDRGAVNILGWQSNSLIKEAYGDDALITNNLRTKIYCQIEDERMAEQIEKKYGYKEEISYLRSYQLKGKKNNEGTSFSEHVSKRAVIPGFELQYLKTTDKFYEFFLSMPSMNPAKLRNSIIKYNGGNTNLIPREEISLSYLETQMKEFENAREAIIKQEKEVIDNQKKASREIEYD